MNEKNAYVIAFPRCFYIPCNMDSFPSFLHSLRACMEAGQWAVGKNKRKSGAAPSYLRFM